MHSTTNALYHKCVVRLLYCVTCLSPPQCCYLPPSFRFPFIEPPTLEAVESSLSILKDQGAMTEVEELTSSGCMLAKLPVDVVIGKMLIMGTLFHVSAGPAVLLLLRSLCAFAD